MTEQNQTEVHEEPPAMAISEFLESIPPSSLTNISDLTKVRRYQSGGIAGYSVFTPEIQLHCPNDTCNGVRFFRRTNASVPDIPDDNYHYFYISYVCSNCRKTKKTFSLSAQRDKGAVSGKCYKFGELPEYGPPTASRLIKLIGPDRELFLKGRRCENQGLGVGAFVYYRRVVENQKNRILDEVIKVSRKVGAPPQAIQQLEAAKAETQFSKALSNVKDAIPQTLLIDGHNPLSLLHSALSDGLHLKTDEECLGVASSIRVVLAELSERLAQALKDEAELNKALTRLMSRKDR
jgi:hypothetical protein